MVIIGETGSRPTRKKTVPVPHCPPQIAHGMTYDRSRVSVVKGQQLARATARPYRLILIQTALQKQLVPRRKHSLAVIKTSQSMLYREITAVCSQIHTKHINTMCGQNVESEC